MGLWLWVYTQTLGKEGKTGRQIHSSSPSNQDCRWDKLFCLCNTQSQMDKKNPFGFIVAHGGVQQPG